VVAAPGSSFDREERSADLGSGDQVIDRPAVVVNLQADERGADGPRARTDESAVIGSGAGLDGSLSRAEGVDAEADVAQARQSALANRNLNA
jgi:hypothetical protein